MLKSAYTIVRKSVARRPISFIVGLIILVIAIDIPFEGRVAGKVVDTATGKPVAGAIIFAQWTKTHGIGLTSTSVIKAAETLSDESGNFFISGPLNILLNPSTVVVYKKGYEVWNNEYLFPTMERRFEHGQIAVQGVEITLNRFVPPYLNLEPSQISDVNGRRKSAYYRWDGKSPLNPQYSHVRNIEFIDTFAQYGKRIADAAEWERPLADAEKNLIINADLRCKVVDSKTGKPIKGAVVDTAGCRKSRSEDKRCGILTDSNGEGFIKLSAPFLTKPPVIEVYKNGYWVFNFDKYNRWVAWNKVVDGITFQLDPCTYTESYCATYEINP